MKVKTITIEPKQIENMSQEEFEREMLKALGLPEDADVEMINPDVIKENVVDEMFKEGLTLIEAKVLMNDAGVHCHIGAPRITRDAFSKIEGFVELHEKCTDIIKAAISDFAKGFLILIGADLTTDEEEE